MGQRLYDTCKGDIKQLSCVGVSPSWLRHRILIPAFAGSTPSTPAKITQDEAMIQLPGFSQC